MRRPFKRYCFALAEKLGLPVQEVLSWSSETITEWMAFDLTNMPTWIEEFKAQEELERQSRLSDAERAVLMKQMLKGK